MSGIYSKSGCQKCKSRRKKCDEKQPMCSACAKWGWDCSYAPQPVLEKPNLRVPTGQHRDLLTHPRHSLPILRGAGNEMEHAVWHSIPTLTTEFFCPTSAQKARDLQALWQLMANDNLLRNAGIACFSTLTPGSGMGRLRQESYGRALQFLQSKIARKGLDLESTMCIMVSVIYLGKMESFSNRSFADPLQHWTALMPLLGSEDVINLTDRHSIPLNVYMFILECLLYHVATQAIHSQMTERAWYLWQNYQIYQRICTLNPVGQDRINLSPFLSGQYVLYNMAFEVTYRLQSGGTDYLTSDAAAGMEAAVYRQEIQLERDFATFPLSSVYTNMFEVLQATYHLFCNSLLECITALREPSPDQRLEMERLSTRGLKLFLKLPSYDALALLGRHAFHYVLAGIWPILIQGCAIYNRGQFELFLDHFSNLQQLLDPGNQKRALLLFKQVAAMLDSAYAEEDDGLNLGVKGSPLPPGFALLHREYRVWELD